MKNEKKKIIPKNVNEMHFGKSIKKVESWTKRDTKS
jgi:hypothetical protein